MDCESLDPVDQNYPVQVLAYTEWASIAQPPKLLAAHVLSDDPQVAPILKVASAELRKKA